MPRPHQFFHRDYLDVLQNASRPLPTLDTMFAQDDENRRAAEPAPITGSIRILNSIVINALRFEVGQVWPMAAIGEDRARSLLTMGDAVLIAADGNTVEAS